MEKKRLLPSRTRSQWAFKMLVNVCPGDIIQTTEHFITKLGMVMQHHKPECNVQKKNKQKNPKNYLLFSRSKTNLVWWYIVISQSVEWKYWIIAFKVKVTVKGQMSVFIQIISSKLSNILQTWYCDASSWAGVSCKKIDLLFSRSRSQQGLIWYKYGSFYYIFWTADPFATKLFFFFFW